MINKVIILFCRLNVLSYLWKHYHERNYGTVLSPTVFFLWPRPQFSTSSGLSHMKPFNYLHTMLFTQYSYFFFIPINYLHHLSNLLLFFPLCTCALATCLLAFCYFLIQESYGTCFTNDIYKHIYNPSINDSSRSIQVSGSGNVANEKQPSMRLYHHHQLTSPVLSWNFSAKDSIFSQFLTGAQL